MVGRPREFDIDEALNAAMATFWAKGYEATSLSDLMSATGLHKGSLYQAFGDKHSLFVQALQRYLQAMRSTMKDALAAGATPLEGLRAAFDRIIDMVDDSPSPMGCMAINALIELAPHDAEVRKIMLDHIDRMRTALGKAVVKAQSAGEISTSRPPELVTAMLMTMMAGIGTTIKGPISKKQARTLINAQIESLA